MVFSCLEVILKHTIEQQQSGKLKVGREEDGGKNGSATAKAIIYLPMNMKLKQV